MNAKRKSLLERHANLIEQKGALIMTGDRVLIEFGGQSNLEASQYRALSALRAALKAAKEEA